MICSCYYLFSSYETRRTKMERMTLSKGWRLDSYHHHARERCYYCSHSLASAASNIPEISGWGPLSSSKFSSSSPRRCCSLRKKKQISSSSPKKKDRTPTMKKKEENAPRHRRRYSPELRACRIRILRPPPPRLGPLSSLSLFFLCGFFVSLSSPLSSLLAHSSL